MDKKVSGFKELYECLAKSNVELTEAEKDAIVVATYPYVQKLIIQSYELGKDSSRLYNNKI